MTTFILSSVIGFFLIAVNLKLDQLVPDKYQSRLVCVNEYIKYFSFGNNNQIADFFWIGFLQELDAFNELKISDTHLCPDNTSSWHFHIINVAMDLDSKFHELALYAPLLISVTISDSKGASILFDKAVANYPDDWKILYRAAFQAQIEEKNKAKAADLLYRAGQKGAPKWVMSLAGGFYNESGNRAMAEQIYSELISEAKDPETAQRLRKKLDHKLKNSFESGAPASIDREKKKK